MTFYCQLLGINSLSFEPTIPSKFMVGTEQGGVIICRMQAKSGTNDWILGEFEGCHQGALMSMKPKSVFI